MKPYPSGSGSYLKVDLSKNGIIKKIYIHRLVAEAYLPNPDNLRDVDHIDGNGLNNALTNLQWMTHQDNCKKANQVKPVGRKGVKVVCVETGEVFNS